jgi:hypothetical protein
MTRTHARTHTLSHTHTHTHTHTLTYAHDTLTRTTVCTAYDTLERTTHFRCMFKASTPGDRKFILHELPVLMTQLEMGLPQTWNTTVVHIYTFHTVCIMMLAGPFCVSNLFKVGTYTHSRTLEFR